MYSIFPHYIYFYCVLWSTCVFCANNGKSENDVIFTHLNFKQPTYYSVLWSILSTPYKP